jgi:hypothetical protein
MLACVKVIRDYPMVALEPRPLAQVSEYIQHASPSLRHIELTGLSPQDPECMVRNENLMLTIDFDVTVARSSDLLPCARPHRRTLDELLENGEEARATKYRVFLRAIGNTPL